MTTRIASRLRTLVIGSAGGIAIGSVAVLALVGTPPGRRVLIQALNPSYTPAALAASDLGVFDVLDAKRTQIITQMTPVASGFSQPTAIVAVPDQPGVITVLEKGGKLMWADLAAQTSGELANFDVIVPSEMGLLGLAFAPDYATSRRIYVSLNVAGPEAGVSKVLAATVEGADVRAATVRTEHEVLQLTQPYANHDGGRLAFGPDGMLYAGFGDGGFRDDPHGHGQRGETWLGSMLRLDVSTAPYKVPADNPFVGRPGVAPEAFAIGLRNPWGFSFTPDGRLISADVGQDLWEEVNLIGPGANLGWNHREGDQCFKPKKGCRTDGLTEPIAVYGREDGRSITGGVVATAPGPLAGKYVFADFVSGRFWAIDIPTASEVAEAPGKLQPLIALGRFSMLPSAFGNDHEGHALVADFGSGTIFRIVPAE